MPDHLDTIIRNHITAEEEAAIQSPLLEKLRSEVETRLKETNMYKEFAKFYKQGVLNGVSVTGGTATGTLSVIVDNATWLQHTIYIAKDGKITATPGVNPVKAARKAIARLQA